MRWIAWGIGLALAIWFERTVVPYLPVWALVAIGVVGLIVVTTLRVQEFEEDAARRGRWFGK